MWSWFIVNLYEEETIVNSSGNLLSAMRLRAGVLGMMKPFSFSLSISSPRSILLSLSSRLRSTDRHESRSAGVALSHSGTSFAVPIMPAAFATGAESTERRARRFPDRRNSTRCRFWRSAEILIRCRPFDRGASRKCAAAHYNAWRRSSFSMSRHSAPRRRRVKW